jgi:signal peptidase I
MNSIDLEFILVLLIIVSFVLIIINKKSSKIDNKILNWLIYQSKSFLPILLIVLFLRSFLAEPFRIPSGSMLPTLLIGDYILVNKYQYGIRLPITKYKLVDISNPERGDVVVFRYPGNEKINFIKRVIGIPGDIVKYEDKDLYVNNIKYKKIEKNEHKYLNDFFREEMKIFSESNKTKSYDILNDNMSPTNDDIFTVPEGKYFVMGDNRDHSSDSRYWGFVPNENLVGKAFFIWMSFNSDNFSFKYNRIGNSIK